MFVDKVVMKTDTNVKDSTFLNISNNAFETTHLLEPHLNLDKCVLQCRSHFRDVSFENPVMGLKDKCYKHVALNTLAVEDSRSQSLPNCSHDESEVKIECLEVTEFCDTERDLFETAKIPSSPPAESWFRTWPERCDKIKNNENNLSTPHSNRSKLKNTQSIEGNRNENTPALNGLTLNEALQNISIAYSPITKQLHYIDTIETKCEVDKCDPNKNINQNSINPLYADNSEQKTLGHRRIEAGSFSSTVSSLSEPSTSGSLLDPDERSLSNFEECLDEPCRKKSFANFISRNVFTWKPPDVQGSVGHVWRLFGKNSHFLSSSPQHIASSSALIQYPRPSNLPAKSQEEEERHREEYKAILAAAKRKEALDTATKEKLEKKQLRQEERLANCAKHFTRIVLPNWETMKSQKKTRELWWQGLPSNVRGKVWSLAIGNDLNLTQQLYQICVARAQARLKSSDNKDLELAIGQEQSLDVIRLDISRTFPHLGIFQEGGPYSEVLHSLLAAYVCYRPDVGYVQGMSYIAAILILNMEQYNAFICFANLLNQPLHLSAFSLNQDQMQAYYEAYHEIFNYNLPQLFVHFKKSGLTPDMYLLDWIYTIFAKAVPLDVACRIWDVFLRDGHEFIFRTALGILYMHQDILLKMDFFDVAQFLTRLPDNISPDVLFKSIQSMTTTIGKLSFNQIVDKHITIFENQNIR